MSNRQALLDSIHTGVQLRPTTRPNNPLPTQNNTGRPLSLMEQMRRALARRQRNRGPNRPPTRLNENNLIWYYVSKTGTTQGPHSIKQMKPKYNKDIDKNTHIWNGTTVAQWTKLSDIKLKDLLQQLSGSTTDCEYIWCCLKCNKVQSNPQICTQIGMKQNANIKQCLGATVWKLRCILCRKLTNEDNICPKCNSRCQPKAALKEAQKKEDYRQNRIFLQGCNNINSNKYNMRLLVSGLINELKDKQLYEMFPIELNECVFMFCFNFKLMDDITDYLRMKSNANKGKPFPNRIALVWSDGNTVVELLDKVDNGKQSVIIEGISVNKLIRKVWRIQILNHVPKTMIDFSIGITRSDNTMYIVKIKGLNIGDVISMLYLVPDGELGTLSFAVNGTMKDVSISEMRGVAYKLVIVMRNPAKLKLIQ